MTQLRACGSREMLPSSRCLINGLLVYAAASRSREKQRRPSLAAGPDEGAPPPVRGGKRRRVARGLAVFVERRPELIQSHRLIGAIRFAVTLSRSPQFHWEPRVQESSVLLLEPIQHPRA
jgi:hypothetical protein